MAGFISSLLKNRLLIAGNDSLLYTLFKPIFISLGILILISGCDSPIGNCPAGLEKIGDKCINTYLQTYEKIIEYGDQVVVKAGSYQAIKDLERAQADLSYAFLELSQIPEDATIFLQVESKMKQYEVEGQKIAQKIEQEEIAVQHLVQVEETVKLAQAQTNGDRTIEELNTAKNSWQKAISILEKIPADTLVEDQVNQFTYQYTEQISGIDLRISNMNNMMSPTMRSTPQNITPVVPNDPCTVINPPSNCVF